MVFERAEGKPAYPTISAGLTDKGVPLGWGALSGLAADPETAGKLYAVSDSVYGNQPAVYTIDATQTPAKITGKIVVTRNGNPAQKLDLEGITPDGKGGFWLASEGNSEKLVPHAIYRVDEKGEIKQEIPFPAELLPNETRFGLEGITTIGEGDDLTLVAAVQREWKDDPKGQVKLLAYNEQTSGPETERVLAAAKQAGIPVVPVTETLPKGKDYIGWMNANLDAVESALAQ